MKRRHVIASMGAFTASGSMVIGSGAFTSAEIERSVSMDVVPDDDGFLGLLYHDEEGDEVREEIEITDGPTDLFYATNQFGSGAEITSFSVEISDDSCLELSYDPPSDFTPGKGVQIEVDENCDGDCPDNITVVIHASGDDFSVEAERSFDISSCSEQEDGTDCTLIKGAGNFGEDTITGSENFSTIESTGKGKDEEWTLSGGTHACITIDVQGNPNITITDVCVEGNIKIKENGTPSLTIEHSDVKGLLDVNISGDMYVNLADSLCIGDGINKDIGGSATLEVDEEEVNDVVEDIINVIVGDCNPPC